MSTTVKRSRLIVAAAAISAAGFLVIPAPAQANPIFPQTPDNCFTKKGPLSPLDPCLRVKLPDTPAAQAPPAETAPEPVEKPKPVEQPPRGGGGGDPKRGDNFGPDLCAPTLYDQMIGKDYNTILCAQPAEP